MAVTKSYMFLYSSVQFLVSFTLKIWNKNLGMASILLHLEG